MSKAAQLLQRINESVNKPISKVEDKYWIQSGGGDNISGPYNSEDEAETDLYKLLQNAKRRNYSQEEIDQINNYHIEKE